MMRLLAALAALLLASTVDARHDDLVDMTVRDLDTGQTLPVYWQDGQAHVPGLPGHRYAVVLSNRSDERLLAVLSVDGVNAVTGETADPHQSGYVLSPWQSTEVRGWRKDLASVAEFVFTDLPDSYAARTGRPRNVGVIGIAVFRERAYRPQPPIAIAKEQRERSLADAAAPSAPASKSAAGAAQELGTGHGDRRYDPARHTQFVRASSQPAQVVSLFYDSPNVLIARGIMPPPHGHRPPRQRPEAFPIGFVPDPPRWGRRW
jgi:hypothetical protein